MQYPNSNLPQHMLQVSKALCRLETGPGWTQPSAEVSGSCTVAWPWLLWASGFGLQGVLSDFQFYVGHTRLFGSILNSESAKSTIFYLWKPLCLLLRPSNPTLTAPSNQNLKILQAGIRSASNSDNLKLQNSKPAQHTKPLRVPGVVA